MPKFRKKPIVIEAERVSTLLTTAKDNWPGLPSWFRLAHEGGKIALLPLGMDIKTLEGTMHADLTDWIIWGVAGELYPCKHDIFEKTYESAS